MFSVFLYFAYFLKFVFNAVFFLISLSLLDPNNAYLKKVKTKKKKKKESNFAILMSVFLSTFKMVAP